MGRHTGWGCLAGGITLRAYLSAEQLRATGGEDVRTVVARAAPSVHAVPIVLSPSEAEALPCSR
jgi:hypothetical protein